jgi:hypothetical protein
MHIVKVISVISLILYFLVDTVYAHSKEKLSWLSLQEAESALKRKKTYFN